jgi:virginiamycin B lyase
MPRLLPLVGLVLIPAVTAAQSVPIHEWTVPWQNTRPRDPYVGPRQGVWFVGQAGDYLALLDPTTGKFRRYDLDPGTGPHNLVVAKDGMVWYTGNRAAHIGRLDPATGRITRYPMPDPAARDPHTLVFDSAGDLWFTVQGGNFVGKLETGTGRVHLLPVPTPNARPYGIVLDGSGRPWVAEFGSNRLAVIDPATMRLEEVPLPRERARPRRLAFSDGAVWYVDYVGGRLGRVDPASRAVKEWEMPEGLRALPYGMAADDRGRIWFVETGPSPNRLVGFDPRQEAFFGNTAIPSGGGAVRHMFYDDRTGMLWFGTDVNTVGRAEVRGVPSSGPRPQP